MNRPHPTPDPLRDPAARAERRLNRLVTALLVTMVVILAAQALALRLDPVEPSTSAWGGLLAVGALGVLALLSSGLRRERRRQLQHRRQAVAGPAAGATGPADAIDETDGGEHGRVTAPRTDALAGLSGPASLRERLAAAVSRSHSGSPGGVGLLLVDLDHFQRVNDAVGSTAGDALLRRIAGRLRASLRPGDGPTQVDGVDALASGARVAPAAAHRGGDGFVVLLEGLASADDAMRVAQRLLAALQPAHDLQGRTVFCTASIGVSTGRGSACDVKQLLRQADMAMHEAKRSGRGRAVAWHDGLTRTTRPAGRPGAAAPAAATAPGPSPGLADPAGGQRRHGTLPGLELLYRPIVALPGLQTLAWIAEPHLLDQRLRREGDEDRPVRLDRLALSDDHALHRHAGHWALTQVVDDLARRARRPVTDAGRRQAPAAPVPVLLPLTRAQWRDPELPERLAAALRASATGPGSLRLAVTEAVATEDETSMAALDAVRSTGASVALMAFGSGSASLASLDRLCIDEVLLDAGFVSRIADSAYQRALVGAVRSVSQALDLRLTADGVESAAQLRALIQLDCRAAAGGLFGEPRPLASIADPEPLPLSLLLR